MPDINLLPWREELREERKRQFFSALALTAVLAGIIGFAWNTWVGSFIDAQERRNQMLETEITALDAQANEIRGLKKRKSEMLDRMGARACLPAGHNTGHRGTGLFGSDG